MLRQEDDDTRSNADRVHRHQATRVIQVVSCVSSGDQLCTIDPGDTFYTLQNQVLVGWNGTIDPPMGHDKLPLVDTNSPLVEEPSGLQGCMRRIGRCHREVADEWHDTR
jgi:hypothetical protein